MLKIGIQIFLVIVVFTLGVTLFKQIKEAVDVGEFQEGLNEFVEAGNEIIDDFNRDFEITYNESRRENFVSQGQIDIQRIIDSAQNVIRDSIKNNATVNYWSYYDTGLPSGKVKRMVSYDDAEFELDNKESSEYDYGIITIEKSDGSLVKERINYEWFLAIKVGDVIK